MTRDNFSEIITDEEVKDLLSYFESSTPPHPTKPDNPKCPLGEHFLALCWD